MAKNINVNRSVNDPFYRYKMPRIMAKVEGKGNGIKTVVANMTEIGKALARPPTYPTKYFGCELGAQTNFDLKNERYIVNGEHDASKLQDILDGFIRKFVLCPACDNPETTLTVKRGTIHSKCKACGHAFLIDQKHKLATFILKNPPPPETIENDNNKRENSPVNVESNCNGDDNIIGEGITNGHSKHLKDDDDDWAPEPITEVAKLSSQVGKLIIDKDLDKTTEERLDMLHQFFIKSKKDGTITDSKKIVNEAERLELKTKAPLLLADVIFDVGVVNQIKVNRNLLLRFCLNDKKAQRHLLGGIEQLIYANKELLLSKTAHIIKALYDTDVCDEEVLLAWGQKPSSKYVKKEFAKELIKVAQPVLTWLEEAEEDTESDEEVSVNFDDRIVSTVMKEVNGNNNAINGNNKVTNGKTVISNVAANDDDEFDIDDI